MSKIAYEFTDGQAHDLRFVHDDYTLKPKEKLLEGDNLPDIDTLHGLDHLKKIKILKLKNLGRQVAGSIVPAFQQRNAALGIYDSAKKALIVKKITAVKQVVDELENQISETATESDLSGIAFDLGSLTDLVSEKELQLIE